VTYLNDTSNMDGVEVPIVPRLHPPHIMSGFSESMSIPGNLTDFAFRVPHSNANSMASGYGNGLSLVNTMGDMNLFAPNAFYFDFPDTGGGGGGSAYTTITTSDTDFIKFTTSPNVYGGTNYELERGDDLCSFLVSCVTAVDGYGNGVSDAGTIAATGGDDTFTISGDWTSGANGRSYYIKTDASSQTVNLSFDRWFHETITVNDSGGNPTTFEAGAQNASLIFEDGLGIKAVGAADSTNTKVTISTTGRPTIVQITGEATAGSVGDVDYYSYPVQEVVLADDGGSKDLEFTNAGVLYDFSVNVKNEPSTVVASFTLQAYAVQTIVTAVEVEAPASWGTGRVYIMGGMPALGVACT